MPAAYATRGPGSMPFFSLSYFSALGYKVEDAKNLVMLL
jgi:hypothetical protein